MGHARRQPGGQAPDQATSNRAGTGDPDRTSPSKARSQSGAGVTTRATGYSPAPDALAWHPTMHSQSGMTTTAASPQGCPLERGSALGLWGESPKSPPTAAGDELSYGHIRAGG